MNVWEWDDPPKWWTSQDHQLHSDCCEQCYGSELFADIRDLAVRGSWRTAADRSAVELSQGSEKNYHEWSIFWGNQTWYQMLLVILRDFRLINNALFWGWCHINTYNDPWLWEAYTYGTSSCIGMTTLEIVCLFLSIFLIRIYFASRMNKYHYIHHFLQGIWNIFELSWQMSLFLAWYSGD